MAKGTYQDKAEWLELDVDTLDTDEREAYAEYKRLYKDAIAQRTVFEGMMQDQAPKGKRMVFGYRFGKLSVALVDKAAETGTAKGKQSLADFLAAQASR